MSSTPNPEQGEPRANKAPQSRVWKIIKRTLWLALLTICIVLAFVGWVLGTQTGREWALGQGVSFFNDLDTGIEIGRAHV